MSLFLEGELKKTRTGGRGDIRLEYQPNPRFWSDPAVFWGASRRDCTAALRYVNNTTRLECEARGGSCC